MAADQGIGRGHIGDGPTAFVIIVFTSIALYNVIELTLIIWWVFKRRGGIYFWSFVVATYGIAVYSVGFILKNNGPQTGAGIYIYLTLIAVGWVCMVTGQSMVLWSRLHLVLRDEFKLRLVLCMIIFDAIAMHVPTIVLLYGTNSDESGRFEHTYSIYEKLQVTVFFVQEVLISSIYIYETTKLSRVLSVMRTKRRSRRLMNHLIFVNVVIIILDVAILALEYAGQYAIQTSYKALVYSAKLKLEFTILNRLVEMTTGNKESSSSDPTPCGRPGCACGGSASHSYQHCHHHHSYPLTPRHPSAAVIAADVPIYHPRIPARQQERRPSVSYEAHAYSRNDSQHELTGRGSSSSTTNNVFRTTEIVVKHEQRSTSESEDKLRKRGSPEAPRSVAATSEGDGTRKSSSEAALGDR